MRIKSQYCRHVLLATLLLSAVHLPARAAEKLGYTVLEEVIVTAQKREQSIRDVPISIMAMDSEFLAEKGVTDFSELSNYVPNVKLRTDMGAGVDLNIRGFSKQSGNPAFDQAVGLLVDGVPYNDNDFFVTGMVDIARIEVLRGPQGTLLGKNTTAGLINITTKRPTDSVDTYIDIQGGEYGHQRLEAAVGGPLLPNIVNIRLAGLDDQRDGVFDNTTAQVGEDSASFFPGVEEKELNRDRQAWRIKLEAPDLFGSIWGVHYERAKVSAIGNGTEILEIDQDSENFLRQYDPNLDVIPGNFTGSENDPTYSQRTVEKLVMSWETEIGTWGLKATGGHANVAGLVQVGDPTPAPLFGYTLYTDKPQSNIDIVLTSPPLFDNVIDITSGLFFETRELDLTESLALNTVPTLGLMLADDPNTSVVLPVNVLPPGILPVSTSGAGQEKSTMLFHQKTNSAALYGQLVWHFRDSWALTSGLRVSTESKKADWNRSFDTPNTLLFTQTLGYEEFQEERKQQDSTVQPKIAINYKPTDDVSLFLHWARGYRSGGFNGSAGRNSGLEYDREVVDEYAFNAKMRLLEGALRLNFGLFRMDLKDFQLLTTGPDDLAAIAVNAGRARAQGAELDLTWLLTQWLSLSVAGGYNDATFVEFPYGPCSKDKPNSDGDADPRCDLAGAALPYSPTWSASSALNIRLPFSTFGLDSSFFADWELLAGIDMEYQTESTVGLPGDDRFFQKDYSRWGANVGLGGNNWSFRLSGKNLTNESINRIISYMPLTDNLMQSVEQPMTVYAQFRWYYE